MTRKSLPGVMHVDHVALTVPNLDAAVHFYGEVLGAIELYRMGPFDAEALPAMPDGTDWTAAHLNIAGARLNFVMMALGRNLMLDSRERRRAGRPPSAVGPPAPHFRDDRSGAEASLAMREAPGDGAGTDFDGRLRL